jgi:soluble lytic murein transglycosylase-like protein
VPFLLPAIAAVLALAGIAHADILVLSSPDGKVLVTNTGEKSGYKVLSRYREFVGSSGMGLRSAKSGDASKYEEAVLEAAKRFALDPTLVKAVIRAESNFNPRAISPKGAMGLMQLMPDTARMHAVKNAFDPADNIGGGVRHLRYLMDRYDGKVDLVLAAYNAGTKPVDAVKGIPRFAETQEYVRRVRSFHSTYRKDAPAMAAVKAGPLVARIDPAVKSLDAVYGVPIVLRAAARLEEKVP